MKKIKFLAMMLFAIVACAGFASCGDDDDDDDNNALVGTWGASYTEDDGDGGIVYLQDKITFTADGKFTGTTTETDNEGTYSSTVTGTYTLSGGKISENALLKMVGTYDDGELYSLDVLAKVSGDELMITDYEYGEVHVYHRM